MAGDQLVAVRRTGDPRYHNWLQDAVSRDRGREFRDRRLVEVLPRLLPVRLDVLQPDLEGPRRQSCRRNRWRWRRAEQHIEASAQTGARHYAPTAPRAIGTRACRRIEIAWARSL